MTFQTIDPSNEEVIETYQTYSKTQVDEIISSVSKAYIHWRDIPIEKRCEYLNKVAALLTQDCETFAALITREMGKPIEQATAEVQKCASVCEYYALHAIEFLADEIVKSDARKSFVSFEPLGIVCGVMPWNFPFWQVFRYAAPTLAAGNTCLLKHASNSTACALAIEQLFVRAGLPENIFRTLLLDHDQLAGLIKRREVAAVTLTGSTEAGRDIAQNSGKALKKVVLELGGSDPYIILEDADIEAAADLCVQSRLLNAGQSCISAKRFIVVKSILDAFEAAFVDRMRNIHFGDPTKKITKLGPLARKDIRETLHQQVQRSVANGARCVLGGSLPEVKGYYYDPCVLTDVTPECVAFNEELFGPVAAIISATDEQVAVELANRSVFGLGAAVFTGDLERGERLARKLEAGTCVVNDFVRSDPVMPFGGIKESGYGRELSHYGIREFVNVKSIVVR